MKFNFLKRKKSLLSFLFSLIILIQLQSQIKTEIQEKGFMEDYQYIKFSSDSIYYKLKFMKNDITGTGNRLKDVPYRTICVLKNCPNICCIGDIDSMVCGGKDQCKEFYDDSIYGNIVAAVIFPILFLGIFVFFYCVFNKISDGKNKALSALLAFSCMFVITIPFVIFFIWKFKPYEENDSNNKMR